MSLEPLDPSGSMLPFIYIKKQSLTSKLLNGREKAQRKKETYNHTDRDKEGGLFLGFCFS